MNNINTIFYYAESLSFSDYITMLQSGEITYRTIVFAQAQKAIYKGGVLYGATDLADLKEQLKTLLDGQEVIQKIEDIVNNHFDLDPQDLPTASTTKKGCIKVGAGLSMSGDTMSVDLSNVPGGASGINGIDGIVEQIIKNQSSVRASKNNYGVVRVGDGIDVTNGIISVSLTQGPKGDKGDTGAKGDKGDTGDRGPAGPSYDDTAIRALINGNISQLQQLIDEFDDRVQQQVESALGSAEIIQGTIPEGEILRYTQEYVDGILQGYGYWTTDSLGNTITKFSEISLRLQEISATVTYLQTHPSGTGGTEGTVLTAEQLAAINDINGLKTAVNSLSSTYALFTRDESDQLKVMRWLSSALDLYANQNATWANLASAAENKDIGQSGIAALRTRVDSLEQGLVAEASLSTLVEDEVRQLINSAGFVAQSDLSNYATTQSVSTMYASVDGKADQALASISAMVEYETDGNGNIINYGTAQDPIYKLSSKVIIDADDITIGERESTGGMSWFSNHRKLSEAIKVGDGYWPEGNFASPFDQELEYINAQIAIYKDVIVLNTDTVATQFRSQYAQFGGYDLNTNMVMLNSDGILAAPYQSITFSKPLRNLYSSGASDPDYNKGDDGVNITFYDISVPGTLTSDTVTANTVTATSLQVTNSFYVSEDITTSGDVHASGDITADGSITADNVTVRNRGDITVGSNGKITSPTINVTNSLIIGNNNGSGQCGIITYTPADYQIEFDSDLYFPNNTGIKWENSNIYLDDNNDLLIETAGGAGVYVNRLFVSDLHQNSDENIKENIVAVSANIEDIAKARVVDFNFKGDDQVTFGSIAQDWQNVFPNAVKKDSKDVLSMNYGSIALASAVIAAREIVELKKKNEELEARLAALEAKLA